MSRYFTGKYDMYDMYDIYHLYDLAHPFAGWEPYITWMIYERRVQILHNIS